MEIGAAIKACEGRMNGDEEKRLWIGIRGEGAGAVFSLFRLLFKSALCS